MTGRGGERRNQPFDAAVVSDPVAVAFCRSLYQPASDKMVSIPGVHKLDTGSPVGVSPGGPVNLTVILVTICVAVGLVATVMTPVPGATWTPADAQ